MEIIPKGTVVKVLHDGQKAYAVVLEDAGKTVTVHYPFAGQNVELTVAKKELRRVRTEQDSPTFDLLRQLVGIPYDAPPSTKTIKGFGTVHNGHKPTHPLSVEPIQPLKLSVIKDDTDPPKTA